MVSSENTLKIGGAIIAQSYGYGTLAVFLISLLSLLGVVLVPFLSKTYYSYLILGLIALAIGTMSGDAFLHLIPQALGLHQHSHPEAGSSIEPSVNGSFHSGDHGHSHSDHDIESTAGQDAVWKLLVVIGTIFVFHMMEILLRYMQASMDAKKGKAPTGHHHHHHHGPTSQSNTDSHNHLVLPALAIPMLKSKKEKNPGEGAGQSVPTNIAQNGCTNFKNRTKDQNLFRKWLASKRKGGSAENDVGTDSNCLTQLAIDKNCQGIESSSGSSSKLVICPDNYLEQHENHYDVVGRYSTPDQENSSDELATPVLLRVCLNEQDPAPSAPPCHLKECDPQETTLCEGQTCNVHFGGQAAQESERVEHRHHELKHDHTSCHHRDIMQAADIINSRKREMLQAGPHVDQKQLFHAQTLPPTSGHVNHGALTPQDEEIRPHRRTLSNLSASLYTNSPQQLLLESSTYPLEKDLNTVDKKIIEKDGEEVKFKGRTGLPFCYGIQSLSLFLILGDIAHNMVDGIAIGAAFSSSLKEGLSTSFAVFCHELPHELGDFAVLVSTGMSFKMALMVNLFAACTSFLGLYISLSFASSLAARQWIFAMTAGMFLYVSLVDMLPELREIKVGSQIWSAFCQNLGIIVGVGLMLLVALYEHLLF